MALKGLRVIELAGLAPAPFCGAILADFGAQVIRVDKHTSGIDLDCLSHGKKSIGINLKHPHGVAILQRLSEKADVLIEPYRKGVMEKLGLGPDVLMKNNPKLIYARLTGYGQSGAMAERAGHDINYIATSGLLSLLGRSNEPPTPPVNLVADFAGGGLMCALGIVMALYHRNTSGCGQVVDASMVEGAAYVGSWLFRGQNLPVWGQPRGFNVLDTGSHFYDTYCTKDGGYMAVGAIEPQFYSLLLEGMGLSYDETPQFPTTAEQAKRIRNIFTKTFASKTTKEWTNIFSETDACVTSVLSMEEAMKLPHNQQRKTFNLSPDGCIVPEAAPRLSATPGTCVAAKEARPMVGQHTAEVLRELNFTDQQINQLDKDGAISVFKSQAKL